MSGVADRHASKPIRLSTVKSCVDICDVISACMGAYVGHKLNTLVWNLLH